MKTSVLTIEPILDRAGLELLHAVEAPAYDHDFVALPADPIEEKVPSLGGVEIAGGRSYRWVALQDGVPAATVSVDLSTLDNLETAWASVIVHPEQRRRGLGRQLTGWALEEVQRLGRTRVWFQAPSPLGDADGPAEPLLREFGARPVLEESRRLLDLQAVTLLEPSAVADGYRIEQYADRAPDHLVDGVAYLNGRMSTDAPMGDAKLEPERWDATRVREKEAHGLAVGRLHLVTVVVHEASGTVAGLTELAVSRARPHVGYQWETIVDPEHRGHRLGLALKTWNHQSLAAESPGTRFVNTWNADSNTFMVSVNELCGFRLAERWIQYELDL